MPMTTATHTFLARKARITAVPYGLRPFCAASANGNGPALARGCMR